MIQTTDTTTRLDQLKINIYRILIPLGLISMLAIWILEYSVNETRQFDVYSRPVFLLILAIGIVLTFFGERFVKILDMLMFLTVAVYFVTNYYSLLLDQGYLYKYSFMENIPEWMPVVFFMAFFAFKTRQALSVSGLFYLAVLLPGLVAYSTLYTGTEKQNLMSLLLSNLTLLVMMSSIAILRESNIRTRAYADAMQQLASIDPLTGIYNRRVLDSYLRMGLVQAQSSGQPYSVILFDMDHFKQINDRFGHLIGDDVLRRTATGILRQVRPSDQLGRWGGEEFLILAINTDRDQALQLAERLRKTLEQDVSTDAIQVTASFGVAQFVAPETPESLISRADVVLYEAKGKGRNCIAAA
jgi:diguanylate cyclase (GGDEF)-like protein